MILLDEIVWFKFKQTYFCFTAKKEHQKKPQDDFFQGVLKTIFQYIMTLNISGNQRQVP